MRWIIWWTIQQLSYGVDSRSPPMWSERVSREYLSVSLILIQTAVLCTRKHRICTPGKIHLQPKCQWRNQGKQNEAMKCRRWWRRKTMDEWGGGELAVFLRGELPYNTRNTAWLAMRATRQLTLDEIRSGWYKQILNHASWQKWRRKHAQLRESRSRKHYSGLKASADFLSGKNIITSETRYIFGITVRGNLAISCKFTPVSTVTIGLILLVVILFGIVM